MKDFIENVAGSKQAEFYIGLAKNKTGSNKKRVPDLGWRWQVITSAGKDCAAMFEYCREKKGCSCRGTGENIILSCSFRSKESKSSSRRLS